MHFFISISSVSLLVLIIKFLKFPQEIKRVRIEPSLLIFYGVSTLLSLVVYSGRIFQRYFVNPDPYGYAAVTGLIKKYDGLPNGFRSIEKFTGVPFSYDASWTDSTQFLLIDSPFHIPDFLVKYGVSNGMFFHNAGSVIGLLFGKNAPSEFFTMWATVTLLSISLVIALACKVCFYLVDSMRLVNSARFENRRKKSNNTAISQENSKGLWIFSSCIITSMFLGSVWLLPMLWEGYLNQFLSYALTLGVFSVSLRIAFELSMSPAKELLRTNSSAKSVSSFGTGQLGNLGAEISKKSLLESLLLLLIFIAATVVTYAQQIPWQILGMACVALFSGWKWLFSNFKNLFLALGVITLTLLLAFLLPQTRRGLAMFSGNGESAGGSMHLGAFSPTRVLVPFSNFDLVQVTDPGQYGNQYFKELIWPGSIGEGYAYKLRGQGYVLVAEGIGSIYMSSLLIVSLLLLIFVLSRAKLRFLSFIFLTLLLIGTNLFYLYSQTGQRVLENGNASFNDYLWVRLWAVTSIYLIPIMVAFLYNAILNLRPSFVKVLNALAAVLLLVSVTYIQSYASNLEQYSINATIVNSCPDLLMNEQGNYYISPVIVPVLGITVCGKNMDFLSDSFPSERGPASVRNVISIDGDARTGKWKIEKIGTLELVTRLKSPCGEECVRSNPGFRPSSNSDQK